MSNRKRQLKVDEQVPTKSAKQEEPYNILYYTDGSDGLVSRRCRKWKTTERYERYKKGTTNRDQQLKDLETLRNEITNTPPMQKLPLSDEINMTQGMKEALLFILDQWKLEVKKTNVKEKSVVLMYYGVPCIGKSTLASALDYYLGLVHGKIWFAQLVHCPQSDSGAILKKIFEHPSDEASNPMNEVYIIDQVNPGVIDVTGLINKCCSRPYPVIMFTSGHYMPSRSWTQTDRVKVTGIHMTIEIKEVQDLYNKIDQNILEDFLKESAVYGQVSKMAFRYAGTENFDEAVRQIRIDYDKMNVALLQVLFTRLFLNFKVWRTFEEMTDRNTFIMEVEDFMHYQQHMKTNPKAKLYIQK